MLSRQWIVAISDHDMIKECLAMSCYIPLSAVPSPREVEDED